MCNCTLGKIYIYDQHHNRINHLKIIHLSSLALMKGFLWALAINRAPKSGLDLCPNSVPWHIPTCPSAQPSGISVAMLLPSTLEHDTKHLQHFHLILPTAPTPPHTHTQTVIMYTEKIYCDIMLNLNSPQHGMGYNTPALSNIYNKQ